MTDVASWHVLSTRSQCEQQVHDHLAAEGFEVFLPRTRRWTTPTGEQQMCGAPLFPGFLFLRDVLDRDRYEAIARTRGLIAVLGDGWERADVLPDSDMLAVRRLLDSGVASVPHAYLCAGQKVRVSRGALAGIEGILARSRPDKALFVMSFPVLKRSVAVEIDRAAVEPIGDPVRRMPARREREAERFLLDLGPQQAA